MTNHQKALEILKQKGPSVSIDVAKQIGVDSMLAGAILSELVSKGQAKYTSVKVGKSHLYYVPGQEKSLERFSQNLNEKDFRAYEYLKQKKVVFDKELSPLYQVAMRSIRDFAKPMQVQYGENKMIVWKYFLTHSQEAQELIHERLSPKKQQREKETEKKPPKEEREPQEKPAGSSDDKVKNERPSMSDVDKQKADEDTKLVEYSQNITDKDTGFLLQIKKQLEKTNIKVIEQHIIRKNAEIDLVLLVPAPVGDIKFYAKAKNKKSVNEGDLSTAILNAESKKMPLIYLSSGKLTKKAQAMMDTQDRQVNFIQV